MFPPTTKNYLYNQINVLIYNDFCQGNGDELLKSREDRSWMFKNTKKDQTVSPSSFSLSHSDYKMTQTVYYKSKSCQLIAD